MSESRGLWDVYWVLTRQRSYVSQTLQGADILAKVLGAQVFFPDFIGEGNECKIETFQPGTEEGKKQVQSFHTGPNSPPITAGRFVDFANVLKGEGFKKIGAIGYCWGNV